VNSICTIRTESQSSAYNIPFTLANGLILVPGEKLTVTESANGELISAGLLPLSEDLLTDDSVCAVIMLLHTKSSMTKAAAPKTDACFITTSL
jgi:hypothetical protein